MKIEKLGWTENYLKKFKSSLNTLNKIVNEFVVVNHIEEYFSEANIDLPLLRLLLTCLGYDKINIETGVPGFDFARVFG